MGMESNDDVGAIDFFRQLLDAFEDTLMPQMNTIVAAYVMTELVNSGRAASPRKMFMDYKCIQFAIYMSEMPTVIGKLIIYPVRSCKAHTFEVTI